MSNAAQIADPSAPSLVWTYNPAQPALWIRAAYTAGASSWTESAGVRACDVLGLDNKPAAAGRALIEYREGRARRKVWVSLSDLASTPAAAAAKMAPHFSALLATERPSKMAVMKVASRAGEFLPAPAGNCPECWSAGRVSALTAASLCAMIHTHATAAVA